MLIPGRDMGEGNARCPVTPLGSGDTHRMEGILLGQPVIVCVQEDDQIPRAAERSWRTGSGRKEDSGVGGLQKTGRAVPKEPLFSLG